VLAACIAVAQQREAPRPVFLMDGLGDLHHPVSASNLKPRNSSIRDCGWSMPSTMRKLPARFARQQ
jgi:hypothetical protein